MSYEVAFTGKAAHQTVGLPGPVFVALNETLRAIARDPWVEAAEDRLEGSEAFRWAPFAGGQGAVHIYVDVDVGVGVVRVHDVTWVG